MRSFFARFIPVFVLLSILLFQLKPVHAQLNPFSGMSAGEAARVTGGFLWDTSPIGTISNAVQGQDNGWEYGDRTSIDANTGRTLTRNSVSEQARIDVSSALGIPTGGSITDALTARLIGFLAFMMGIIVSFLGKVISLLINVLLGFLTYNGFADAPPVVIAWKIVRDLVNMFFIVILILSSYATILGWKTNELHVKNVLPKVLLAAVLVNFSKTIVALLIDASQVVMLTFVNAFAAIGAGNFTNALHLPLIAQSGYADQLQAAVSSTAQSVTTNGAGQVIIDVILASALQIFLLIVAIGVMMMMVVFVVARIVGLWMLLIFSPIPFLAEALPGSMKNVLGKQVADFWPRLTGLLTGGPIMAFWLWLTFATLSAQGADERLGLFSNSQVPTTGAATVANAFQVGQNVTSAFITRIGNAQGLGSYIIAIAMMMMGLEAAMAAADAVKETGGGLMKSIGNKSKDYASRAARFTAYGGVAAGGVLAARGAYKATSATAGLVDRKYDLRGRAAAFASKAPLVGGAIGNNAWVRKQRYANTDEEKKRQGEFDKILNDPRATAEEKERARKGLEQRYALTGDKAILGALSQDVGRKADNEKAYEGELKGMKDGVKAAVLAKTGDPRMAKQASDRAGKQEATRRRLTDYEKQKMLIEGNSKEAIDARQKIDDSMKKLRKDNPHLITDEAERKKQMAEVRQNFNSLDEDARGNFEVLKNFAVDGAFKDDGKGNIMINDMAAVRATRKKLQGKNKENFDAMVNYVKESKGTIPMTSLKNLSVEQDANDQRRVFETTRDAKTGAVVGGEFVLSQERRDKIKEVQTDFTAANKGTWFDNTQEVDRVIQPMVKEAEAAKLVNAAKTVGVSQAVQNVGVGASASEAPAMRAAAVHSIAKSTAAGLAGAGAYLNQPRTYQDAAGNDVTRTNAEILRDKSVPANAQARAAAGYQKEVNEVLPILNGMEELSGDEQIEFMAAMGQNNVGQALNSAMMRDPEVKAATKNLQMAVNANAERVNEYFSGLDEQTTKDYDDFKQYTEYESKMYASPAGQAEVAGNQRLQTADADFRAEYFRQTPGAERSYNEYVRYEAAKASVKPKGLETDTKFNAAYSKYVKYDNARSAINQFNSTGGKGSNSASRNRGGGGGGRRGGGGGAPTT